MNYYTADNGSFSLNNYHNNYYNHDNQSGDFLSWTLDSGASYHMTHNKSMLTNIKNIYFANRSTIKSKLIGQYIGYINDEKIILNDVLYIPTFRRSLLSINHLSEDLYKTLFHKNMYNYKNCALLYKQGKKSVYIIFQ